MLQVLNVRAISLSTNTSPEVRVITLAGGTSDNTLSFSNPSRSLVVGYGGAAYGARNGNAEEADLVINVLQGSGENTWLLSQDVAEFPIFSGSVSCEFITGDSAITRTYELKEGTIISKRGLTISTDGGNESQSVQEWTLKFTSCKII